MSITVRKVSSPFISTFFKILASEPGLPKRPRRRQNDVHTRSSSCIIHTFNSMADSEQLRKFLRPANCSPHRSENITTSSISWPRVLNSSLYLSMIHRRAACMGSGVCLGSEFQNVYTAQVCPTLSTQAALVYRGLLRTYTTRCDDCLSCLHVLLSCCQCVYLFA